MDKRGVLKMREIIIAAIFILLSVSAQSENFSGIKSAIEEAVTSGDMKMSIGLIADKDGDLLNYAAGFRDEDSLVKMEHDSIIQIASMTKLVTTIAILQLVEKEKIALDNQIDFYLPELANLKILKGFDQGAPVYVEPSRRPTVRELITHTSGFTYDFLDEDVYALVNMGLLETGLKQPPDGLFLKAPLIAEPNKKFQYGISIDWLGVLVERVSELDLITYFDKYIFEPLEMVDTFYEFPSEKMDRASAIWIRSDAPLPSFFQRLLLRVTAFFSGSDLIHVEELQPKSAEKGSFKFYTGGGGLYSTTSDYSKILRMLLNNGVLNERQILSEEMIDKMFDNHSGDHEIQLGSWDMGFGAKANWGLGFMVHPAGTSFGRSENSASWGGIFNSYYWIDRETGIAGIFATQLFPFFDERVIKHYNEFESEVYKAL